MHYRFMSPGVAVSQFERMFEYNPWCSTLFGVDNIMPTEFIDTVIPKLNPPHGENILYEVKVNNLGRRELRTLAAGGVKWVQPGIEALATHTLKLMGKGVSSFQNVIFLKDCIDCGVCAVWNLLTGFPGELGETYKHYLHCIPLLYHLPPPTGLTRVRFDRYSPYFTKADEYGLELQPFAYYSLTFPFAEDALREIAYYFTDERGNEYKRLIDVWWASLDPLVETWRDRWSDPRQAPICRLSSTDAAWTIVDTRGDQPQQYEITAERAKLLHALGKARRVTQLIARGGPGVSGDLEWLRERGLLFEERGRVLSLVHADSPATTETLLAETLKDRLLLSDGQ